MPDTNLDLSALVDAFSRSTAKQGDVLRLRVQEAVLQGLKGRELSLQNIRAALDAVGAAASTGAAKNSTGSSDVEKLLQAAVDGMDGALLQTVEAHRRALEQFVEQGADLREAQLKGVVAQIEKLEDAFIGSLHQVALDQPNPLQAAWTRVIQGVEVKGSQAGNQAATSLEQLTAMTRDSRTAGLKAGQAFLDSYSALVSGVLIGMADGLRPQTEPSGKRGSATAR